MYYSKPSQLHDLTADHLGSRTHIVYTALTHILFAMYSVYFDAHVTVSLIHRIYVFGTVNTCYFWYRGIRDAKIHLVNILSHSYSAFEHLLICSTHLSFHSSEFTCSAVRHTNVFNLLASLNSNKAHVNNKSSCWIIYIV